MAADLTEETAARTEFREMPVGDGVHLIAHYCLDDLREAYRHVFGPGGRQGLTAILFFVSFGLASTILLGSTFGLLFILLSLLLWRRSIDRQARTLWERETAFHDEVHWTFDEAGVEVRQTGAHSTVSWRRYRQAEELEGVFLIWPQDRLFHIVPKRAFDSTEELERFRELLRRNVKFKARR